MPIHSSTRMARCFAASHVQCRRLAPNKCIPRPHSALQLPAQIDPTLARTSNSAPASDHLSTGCEWALAITASSTRYVCQARCTFKLNRFVGGNILPDSLGGPRNVRRYAA